MSGLDCDSCESKLHLAYGEKILTLSSGEKIAVEHTPFLVCDVCQKRYISPLAKELLDELKKLVESAEQEEEKNTFFHFDTDIIFSDRTVWFITLILDDVKL